MTEDIDVEAGMTVLIMDLTERAEEYEETDPKLAASLRAEAEDIRDQFGLLDCPIKTLIVKAPEPEISERELTKKADEEDELQRILKEMKAVTYETRHRPKLNMFSGIFGS